MSKEEFGWKKALGVAGVVGILAVGGNAMMMPNGVDNDAIQKTVEDAVKAEMDNNLDELNLVVKDLKEAGVVSEDSLLKEIHGSYFEEDAWEAESEILALDELEDRDFKDLKKWMVSELGFGTGSNTLELEGTDYKDIDNFEVVMKDVKVLSDEESNFDVDDRNAVVERELKIYFEDNNGDRVKKYIKVRTTIVDNEIVDQEFE